MKTLKDLECSICVATLNPDGTFNAKMVQNGCCASQLRAEAIKWIKELQRLDDLGKEPDNEDCAEMEKFSISHYERCAGTIYQFENVVEWIKHFFNITDEELK